MKDKENCKVSIEVGGGTEMKFLTSDHKPQWETKDHPTASHYKNSLSYKLGQKRKAEFKESKDVLNEVMGAVYSSCGYLEPVSGLPKEAKFWSTKNVEFTRISIEKAMECMDFAKGLTEEGE